MSDSPAEKIRAGEAYLAAAANDPESRAAWDRARKELQLFSVAISFLADPELEEMERKQWQELTAALRAAVKETKADLEERRFPRPATLDDWQRLGEIIDMPRDYLESGKWTIREVAERALIWADRHKIIAKLTADANRELGHSRSMQVDEADIPTSASSSPATTDGTDERPSALQRLLRLFTNGMADDRISQAADVVDDDGLTTHEKLTKIDTILPVPAKASAEQLGELLGVSKQAVLKSQWWVQQRKGEKADEVGRRHSLHQQRAKLHESRSDDDE